MKAVTYTTTRLENIRLAKKTALIISVLLSVGAIITLLIAIGTMNIEHGYSSTPWGSGVKKTMSATAIRAGWSVSSPAIRTQYN